MGNYTYILRCGDGSLYTGWTNDLEKRLRAHQNGRGAKYTASRLPVELVYYETYGTKEEAMAREFRIKQLTRAGKEALVRKKHEVTQMNYGIQMYSVRDITKEDLLGALKKVAEIGYRNIEFAGFFGQTAENVKQVLDENGLTASGTHSGIQLLVEDYEGIVAYHKAIGCTDYIIPGADLSTREKLDDFIEKVNFYQPKLREDGLRLSYHNHSFEFIPNLDGQIPYDEITSRTEIGLEIDTYWAYNAGKDPVEMMERFKDRLNFIHIKDGLMGGEGRPLGEGTAPVGAVYRKAAEMGVPMVVESETLKPDGLTEAAVCFRCLKTLEAGA